MRSLGMVTAALVLAAVVTTAAGAGVPTVHFRVFARTGLRLTDIVWTGRQFLSRLGNPFAVPDWFTAGLPRVPLDGELWIGRKLFQRLADQGDVDAGHKRRRHHQRPCGLHEPLKAPPLPLLLNAGLRWMHGWSTPRGSRVLRR